MTQTPPSSPIEPLRELSVESSRPILDTEEGPLQHWSVFLPTISLLTDEVTGWEVLARAKALPGDGILSPDEFFPELSSQGRLDLVRRSIRDAFCLLQLLGPDAPPVWVNIDPSELHLYQKDVAWVLESFPGKFGIELLESQLESNDTRFGAVHGALVSAGCLFAMDDFGTGFSNVGRLCGLEVDIVKLDRNLVRPLDRRRGLVVSAIVGLSASMGFDVLAEGVELDDLPVLLSLGVEDVASWALSLPLAADHVIEVSGRGRVVGGNYPWSVLCRGIRDRANSDVAGNLVPFKQKVVAISNHDPGA